jgi:ABC-type Fe3+-hydroxamate transport system substrate-binding protein
MIKLTDDRGQTYAWHAPPSTIVSLVPSETASVARLGCAGRLVGRTDYCVDPPDLAARVPSVGGTKNPRVEQILEIRPDVVLANQEENSRGDIDRLTREGVRVFVSFPRRVAAGVGHLARLARLLGVEQDPAARALVKQAYAVLHEAEAARAARRPVRVFVPIWMDPLMTVHGDTFISDMLDLAGAVNVFEDRPRRYPLAADLGAAAPLPAEKVAGRDTRYPRVTLDEVIARAPDIVLLPDEPHAFSEADAEVFRAAGLPAARFGAVAFCSGKDLCWPGAQSVEGLPRMVALVDALRGRVPAAGVAAAAAGVA